MTQAIAFLFLALSLFMLISQKNKWGIIRLFRS